MVEVDTPPASWLPVLTTWSIPFSSGRIDLVFLYVEPDMLNLY